MSKRDRASAFEQFRNRKGIVLDDEDLFLEVSEEEYDRIRRQRVEDDFVVDDDAGLYKEQDGGDDWMIADAEDEIEEPKPKARDAQNKKKKGLFISEDRKLKSFVEDERAYGVRQEATTEWINPFEATYLEPETPLDQIQEAPMTAPPPPPPKGRGRSRRAVPPRGVPGGDEQVHSFPRQPTAATVESCVEHLTPVRSVIPPSDVKGTDSPALVPVEHRQALPVIEPMDLEYEAEGLVAATPIPMFYKDIPNPPAEQETPLSAGIDDQWPASFPGDIWSHSLYWLDISSSSDGDVTLFGISAEGHGHKRMSVNIPAVPMPIYLLPVANCEQVVNEIKQVLGGKLQFRVAVVGRSVVFPMLNTAGLLAKREFNKDVVKLVVSSRDAKRLPSSLRAGGFGNTWSHCIGGPETISPSEQLLLSQRIKGPCWLRLKPQTTIEQSDGTSVVKPAWMVMAKGTYSTCHRNVKLQGSPWAAIKGIRSWNGYMSSDCLSAEQEEVVDQVRRAVVTRFEDRASCVDIPQRPSYEDGPEPALPTLSCVVLKPLFVFQKKAQRRSVLGYILGQYSVNDETERKYSMRNEKSSWADELVIQWEVVLRRLLLSESVPDDLSVKVPGVRLFTNEKQVLLSLCRRIAELDPDVLVGHTLIGGSLDALAQRMAANKITGQLLSRLKRPPMAKRLCSSYSSFGLNQRTARALTVGRLMIDISSAARELLGSLTTYTVESLASNRMPSRLFDPMMTHVCMRDAPQLELGDAQERLNNVVSWTEDEADERPIAQLGHWLALINSALQEARATAHLQVGLCVLSITRELTAISGYFWQGSLFHQRAERNASMLNFKFTEFKVLLPMPVTGGPSVSGPQYEGGLVLDPRSGFYDTLVLVFDFNSLYPSIIREFNLCWTTVDVVGMMEISRDDTQEKGAVKAGRDKLLAKCLEGGESVAEAPGVLPEILAHLVKKRQGIKKAIKQISETLKRGVPQVQRDEMEVRMAGLETKSLAIKLSANSVYGCLGYARSRYQAQDLASTITGAGRKILLKTKEVVEQQLRLNVLYGDTDSIMVDTGLRDGGKPNLDMWRESRRMAEQIVVRVNQSYKHLELELEDTFHRLLLHKKKKYAASKVLNYEAENVSAPITKGLDMVRRDWSIISRQLGGVLLSCLFKSETLTEAAQLIVKNLEQVSLRLDEIITAVDEHKSAPLWLYQAKRSGEKLILSDFVITKSITKDLDSYGGAAEGQAHVRVGRWMKVMGRSVPQGTEIEYIICTESVEKARDRVDNGEVIPPTFAPISGEFSNPVTRAVLPMMASKFRMIPDIKWYRRQQLLPPAQRLLTCLDEPELQGSRIQEAMGIKDVSSAGWKTREYAGEERATAPGEIGAAGIVEGSFREEVKKLVLDLVPWICDGECGAQKFDTVLKMMACPTCGKPACPLRICNSLMSMRRRIYDRFYDGVVLCLACNERTENRVSGQPACRNPACLTAGDSNEGLVVQESGADFIYELFTYLSYCASNPETPPGEAVEQDENDICGKQIDALLSATSGSRVGDDIVATTLKAVRCAADVDSRAIVKRAMDNLRRENWAGRVDLAAARAAATSSGELGSSWGVITQLIAR